MRQELPNQLLRKFLKLATRNLLRNSDRKNVSNESYLYKNVLSYCTSCDFKQNFAIKQKNVI